MINLHKYLKENYGLEDLQLLQLWGKGVIRECNYKNHEIFTLRCIGSNLVPVSAKLRSSCSKISQRARKIIEKTQKQLLQDRVRCINNTIEASMNIINNSRTRLASIVTNTADLDRHKRFINKVREERFGNVKDRQVRKFNILISKNSNKHNTLEQGSNTNEIDRIDSISESIASKQQVGY